ncbi:MULTISPECIES: peptidylprolyl isomerase [unclassified Nitratireductor]|uniref:peptidylprolyl isomerase n=1 Tax=unclassified Nitratireductor TaxID=2641084 RepID=UPI000D0CC0EE|nr:peptidylprolyl isomerase [Nitratireductor sp. StC3]PSM15986.1 peptidylprolyl isomerase [Nitratireductor sp. StC3]
MMGWTKNRYRESGILIGTTIVSLSLLLGSVAGAQDASVVGRVNGQDITADDLAIAEQMYSQQLGQMPEDAKRSMLVDALIELRIVAEAALKANVADQEAYKRQLAFFEAQSLRSLFLEQRVAAAVTDEAVKAAYDDQVGKIPPVLERRLRHILLRSESDAVEVIEALKGGKAFAELAQERSADEVSKVKGGDLGFVAEGQVVPEVDAAAAKLQPGEFTQSPVASAFGFHVVLVEETRNRPAPAFEAVAAQVRQALEATEERRIISELRAAAKVEKLVPDVAPPEGDDGHEH